ncbi:MAG TPA: hypothetical protein VFV38_41070 [Ktedonobacteraceae bacterium]|nr:hypothetical protein [Ktedonobacteraceae bacterium]
MRKQRNGGAPLRVDVRRDREQSRADFVRIVWPLVRDQCRELRGSTLRMVEGLPQNPIADDLDIDAGIDAYQRTPWGLRGMSSRVQWWKNYQTFTVRSQRSNGSRTEYGKRLATIKHLNEGFLYPYWTIQAYLERPGGTLLSVAVARTVELYGYIEQRKQSGRPCRERRAGSGGEWFLCVEWKQYRQTGNDLFVSPSLIEATSPP